MYPTLLEWGDFRLFSYPFFIGIAWAVSYHVSKHLFKIKNIKETNFNFLYWYIFLGSWISAKLFYLIFSAQGKSFIYLYEPNFWLGGGLVFYGGLFGGLLVFSIYSLLFKKMPFYNGAYFIPGLIFAHSIGRIGCFLAGCCYGTPSQLFWSVHLHGLNRHPVQLYESILLFIFGWIIYKSIVKGINEKKVILSYFLFYPVLRFSLEFFRGDTIRGQLFGLSTSQMISLGMVLLIGLKILGTRFNFFRR